MSDIELIIDFHINSKRQGPGSVEETLKALSFMNLSSDRTIKIADIGCGSGGQTMTLVQNLDAQITAMDVLPEFLTQLEEDSEKLGLTERITTLEQSMEELPFQNEEFDIIWSEGAIYNIGFERGIRDWKKFLKKGGYLAVSEITWLTSTRPKELDKFWTGEYSEIDTASNKIRILEDNGYTLTGYFILNDSSWINNYYEPMEARFEAFLNRNNYSDSAKALVEEHKDEIQLFHDFKDYYNYGFYIARKN